MRTSCRKEREEVTMPHKKLFIPGPTEVHPEVLKAMATPMIGHRSGDYCELQKRVTEKVQKLARTANPILFSASSGSGLMEGAIRCCTAKRAIVFSVGTFGNRWFEIAQGNGVPADKYEVEWGQGLTPEMIEQYLSTGQVRLRHPDAQRDLHRRDEPPGGVCPGVPKVPGYGVVHRRRLLLRWREDRRGRARDRRHGHLQPEVPRAPSRASPLPPSPRKRKSARRR